MKNKLQQENLDAYILVTYLIPIKGALLEEEKQFLDQMLDLWYNDPYLLKNTGVINLLAIKYKDILPPNIGLYIDSNSALKEKILQVTKESRDEHKTTSNT